MPPAATDCKFKSWQLALWREQCVLRSRFDDNHSLCAVTYLNLGKEGLIPPPQTSVDLRRCDTLTVLQCHFGLVTISMCDNWRRPLRIGQQSFFSVYSRNSWRFMCVSKVADGAWICDNGGEGQRHWRGARWRRWIHIREEILLLWACRYECKWPNSVRNNKRTISLPVGKARIRNWSVL